MAHRLGITMGDPSGIGPGTDGDRIVRSEPIDPVSAVESRDGCYDSRIRRPPEGCGHRLGFSGPLTMRRPFEFQTRIG